MFFDDSTPDRAKRAARRDPDRRAVNLAASPVPPAEPYEFLTHEDLTTKTLTLMFDAESYVNYFLIGFKCAATRKVVYFEAIGDEGFSHEQRQRLVFILMRHRIVGFNSDFYDMLVMSAALLGLQPFKMKHISNELINEEMRPYDIRRKYNLPDMPVNHIDLIEVAPIEASLKLYGARLHSKRLQDLPYAHDAILTPEQMAVVRDYNLSSDLDATLLLWDHLKPQLELREALGKEYGIDLRSKSDAQIAEACIASELRKRGIEPKRPEIEPGLAFQYKIPEFIQFKTPQFKAVLEAIRHGWFEVGNSGRVVCPDWLENLAPRLGCGIYRMGIGGLHSSEENAGHVSDEETLIIDKDVASYYPAIKLNCGLYPSHLGPEYLEVYREFVDKRLKAKGQAKRAKEAGDEALSITFNVTADGLKITINGAFGKLGDPYSIIYAPDLLIQVTLTGQLSLMMLIEMIELAGIPVVSANTDGIVIKCPKSRYEDLEHIVMTWEERTGFKTEEARYKSIWSRDVNNYMAVKLKSRTLPDGSTEWLDEVDGVKLKGVYAEVGSALNSPLSKNPEAYIVSMAVQAYLAHGVPIRETVETGGEGGPIKAKHYPTKLSRFVSVKRVRGGAQKNDVYLGKVVRWYHAIEEKGGILTVQHGTQVGGSEGGKPLMNLPEFLPNDIDYDWYVDKAIDTLYDLGRYQRPTTGRLI